MLESNTSPSQRPTPLTVEPEGIPEELRRERRWVLWSYQWNGKKWTKVPYQANAPTTKAASTDPRTWATFERALGAYENGKADGIGFVLGDGWSGLDLDFPCFDDAGELLPLARGFVEPLESYAERSPSGSKLHVLTRGELPEGRRKKDDVEMYSSGRYFTVTGHHVPATPATVEERTAELAELHARVFANGDGRKRAHRRASASSSSSGFRLSPDAKPPERFAALLENDEIARRTWEGARSDLSDSSPSGYDLALGNILVLAGYADQEIVSTLIALRRRNGWALKLRADYFRRTLERAREQPKRTHARTATRETKPEETKRPARHFVEALPVFVERIKSEPVPRFLIPELIPERTIGLRHGQPRARKSLESEEEALSLAAGVAPFGLERFEVSEPVPVLYHMAEDVPRMTSERFEMLAAGHGLAKLPELLYLSCRAGIDLDDAEWQEALIEAAKRYGVAVTYLDPMRALSSAVDQGPAELKPLASFLRRYVDETGSAVVLVHHDVKPKPGVVDSRARPQRASGGGIFSICEAPIALEAFGKTTLCAPEGFKFSEDPSPFTFRVVVEDGAMRLEGKDATASQAANFELAGRILEHLGASPGASTRDVQKAVQARYDAVKECLERLAAEGKVDATEGKRRATYWYLPDEKTEAQ